MEGGERGEVCEAVREGAGWRNMFTMVNEKASVQRGFWGRLTWQVVSADDL